ncbi:MAG: hypothetical protein SGJ19_27805 [Planctomycetia bacterium]|nr:hypothetical protein [Planctomycetia bacterium]
MKFSPVLGHLGDTNADDQVDIEDLNNVRNNFGGDGLGDTGGDNDIDFRGLNAVRNNFGAVGATAVPRPPSLALLAPAAIGLVLFRRLCARPHRIGAWNGNAALAVIER